MPRSTSGSDVYIYNTLDAIVPFFCKFNIHPNIVTLITIILSGLFYKIIRQNKNNNYLLIFSIIIGRTILDCLDGEVARQCDKKSEFGSYFDTFSDIIFSAMYLTYILPINFNLKNIAMLGLVIYIVAVQQFNFDPSTHNFDNPILKLYHDNTIIKSLFMCYIYYYISKSRL